MPSLYPCFLEVTIVFHLSFGFFRTSNIVDHLHKLLLKSSCLNYTCLSLSWTNFHVYYLLKWFLSISMFTLGLCFTYDSYMFIENLLVHAWFGTWYTMEKLVGIYCLWTCTRCGTSCARGGPHISLWYWFMMNTLLHERYIYVSYHFVEFACRCTPYDYFCEKPVICTFAVNPFKNSSVPQKPSRIFM